MEVLTFNPHDSTKNISIKTNRLYQRLSRHMRNFLHVWYSHIAIPFLYMKKNNSNGQTIIYLFWFTKHIGICFNCFLEFFISIYIHLPYDFSPNHIILCIFLFVLCTTARVCSTCTVCNRQIGTDR